MRAEYTIRGMDAKQAYAELIKTLREIAMLGSVAMMLRHGFSLEAEAAALESAIDRTLESGLRTPDLGGEATTEEAVQAVLSNL